MSAEHIRSKYVDYKVLYLIVCIPMRLQDAEFRASQKGEHK